MTEEEEKVVKEQEEVMAVVKVEVEEEVVQARDKINIHEKKFTPLYVPKRQNKMKKHLLEIDLRRIQILYQSHRQLYLLHLYLGRVTEVFSLVSFAAD